MTLIGATAAVIILAALVGWAFGSAAWGFLVGAILGIPAGWSPSTAGTGRRCSDGVRTVLDAAADARPARCPALAGAP